MKEIDKLAWLHIKDKQLLVARSKGKKTYYVPGGKREQGETDQVALIREIKEELSVNLTPTTITYARTFKAQAHEKPNQTQVKLTCFFAEFTGELKANAEIEEITWLSYEGKTHCSPATQKVLDWLRSMQLI